MQIIKDYEEGIMRHIEVAAEVDGELVIVKAVLFPDFPEDPISHGGVRNAKGNLVYAKKYHAVREAALKFAAEQVGARYEG